MVFFAELVDTESAERFFDEAMETVANLQNLPRANATFKDDPDVRKVQMENHKVAIVKSPKLTALCLGPLLMKLFR